MSTVFIISAPSGSGKTTLAKLLRESDPHLLFSVSFTTRQRRTSEQNGREYHFISENEFKKMVENQDFLEHAQVHDNFYGTAKTSLRDAQTQNKDLLLDIDVQGAAQIKSKIPDAVSIFVLPPSRDVLERRLRDRKDSYAEKIDSEETIRRRLRAAAREVENYSKYDYILVNNDLETTLQQLKAIVLSERARRSGRELSGEERKLTEVADMRRLEKVKNEARRIVDSFSMTVAPSGTTR
jgi:guanylate kinase